RVVEYRRWRQGASSRAWEGAAGPGVGREGRFGGGTAAWCFGLGADAEWDRGPDRVSGEAARIHPRLSSTATRGPVDREYVRGEIQRLGGVRSVQAPWNELVSGRGAGVGSPGGGTTQWGIGRLATRSPTPRENAARTGPGGRLSSRTGALT